jgi:hypothetical protein
MMEAALNRVFFLRRTSTPILWLWCCFIAIGALISPVWSQQATVAPAVDASAESLAAWKYDFSPADEALLEKVERGCFEYFWREVGTPAMLAKDKTSDTVCSIAAVGFQLSSLPIAVERGWISRAEGHERALTVLRSLVHRQDNKKFGIYFHYLDERSGGLPDYSRTKHRYELQASTVDHALLQSGAMTAGSYFGGEVDELAEDICAHANWRAVFDEESGWITMGWRASTERGPNGPGEIRPSYWEYSSDEERLIYFLAVGSPIKEHAVEPAAYYRLRRPIKRHRERPPYVVSWNGSLFTYFFSHCWIGYRHLAADDPGQFGIEAPGVDWFENSRRAVLTHRARCIEASAEFPTLSANRWGLAPCSFRDHYFVHEVRPNISDNDVWYDGVVPPYAAGSAIMFAPHESLAAMREYISLKGPDGQPLSWRDPADGGYGFVDSFSLDPPYGHDDNLGIDAGPLLLAIENARTGLVWRLFMQHDVAERAVRRLRLERRD